MTRAANAGELIKLRSDGQWSKWRVIIDKPDVVYTCRSTGTLVLSSYYIPFDGASGTQINVLRDMTVLVGSTSGGSERGITRVRIAPDGDDSDLHIGADPSFGNVQNDDYITVLNDFAPFAKPTADIYVDFDTEYLDQFDDFVPVPVFTERVAVINAGGTVHWNAAASWVPGSTISGYAWTFTGATATSGTTTATPTATYNTSGRFRVMLTVTAANGKTAVGYGWVYVLGPNLAPDTGIVIDEIEGEYQQGWACQMVAYDRPTIKDRARVVLYSEDYFANELGSIGPVTDRENLLMVGWIIGETIIREPGQDYVEFTVAGPGVFCESVACMPAGIIDTGFPEEGIADIPDWGKMTGLTIVKALHYMINYRSTLATILDVYVEDFTTVAHAISTDSENLWGQLTEIAGQGLLDITSDRYGHIYAERDIALMPVASRSSYPTIMTMTDADWSDELAIIRRQAGDAAMAEVEGQIYTASTGILTPVGGRAPGDYPAAMGDVVNISDLSILSGAGAIQAAGLLAGKYNAEYENISGTHPANNHFIDLCPRQYVKLTIDGATVGAFPRRLTLRREAESGAVSLEMDLEGEGGQWPAVSIDYPDEDDPPVDIPDIPDLPPPPPPDEPPELPPEPTGADAVVVTSTDIKITADLDQASPAWTSIISGGPTTPIDSDLPETTNDILYVIEEASIWKCTGVTGTPAWAEVWTSDDLGTGGGGVAISFEALTRIRVAPGSADLVYVLGYGQVDGDMKPFVLRSSNGGTTWSESWIDDVLPEATPYTVTTAVYNISWDSGQADFDTADISIPRVGDDVAGTYNPWAMAMRKDFVCTAGIWVLIRTDTDHINNFGESTDNTANGEVTGWTNTLLSGGDLITAKGWLDDYFGVGGYTNGPNNTRPMPKEDARNKTKYGVEIQSYDPQPAGSLTITTYVFWSKPNASEPTALDVARTNSAYVYVGTKNKVWKSIDGGYTWTQSLNNGSNDIHVDPQLAGVYYQWSDDGNLELVIADAVSGSALDTETPVQVGLRLARDLNSGRLWSLKSGTTLRLRNLGASSDLDTGLSGARGLHCYLGGKLIYLDGGAILYSDDYGATQADKTGDWSGFSSPINAHLMRTT